MDWNIAIERNRAALKRVVAMLVAMAGAAHLSPPIAGEKAKSTSWRGQVSDFARGGIGLPVTLPRHLHRAILRLLRPAESAARRLVIVMARGLAATPPLPSEREAEKPKAVARCGSKTASARTFGLPLFDPPRRLFRPHRPALSGVPRIWFPGAGEPFPVRPPSPLDDIDATRLALRLAALSRALDDLPAQARRFARWRARAHHADIRKSGRARRVWPLRAGRPPGQRPANNRRAVHEVHEILRDLHGLAFDVLECPDTS